VATLQGLGADRVGAAPAAGLPQRLIVFGISSLSMQSVQALAALGQVCQVLMLVQNPCRYFWGDVLEDHARLRQQVRRRQPVKSVLASNTATHPLLASWGQQGRDYLHLLDGYDQPEQYQAHWSRVDVFSDPASQETSPERAAPPPASQLAQIQSAILNLTPPGTTPQAQADDGSISFVTAHSAQRELEVLHDQLLLWFNADPTLLARDVMVMVPDMPAFAPHIHAVFGRFTPTQRRFIPYSVADTTPRQSPLVQALASLLNLPNLRPSLADWLAWFEVPAIRQRFGLDEVAVKQVQSWLQAAGVRWGLDEAHRLGWGLPPGTQGLAHNTWAFGLRRLLLGYAVGNVLGSGLSSGLGNGLCSAPESAQGSGADAQAADSSEDSQLWQGMLAQPALSGLDAPLAAGLLDWTCAIEQTLPQLQIDQTPAQWGQTLRALVASFFASADEIDERAIERLLSPLDDWLLACEQAELVTPLPLDVVREHWLSQLEGSSLQQRFFGGGVQFGTLMPMRAIPFQVICLLGMNDGAYPRVQAERDFDLMASSWRAGDRSRREDDRYLFLEALLSARQKLYLSWQGHSASDNSPRPPSVLVAQLLDHVNACWNPPHRVRAQPLQPFSQAYFEVGTGCCTFATEWEHIRPLALMDSAEDATENRVNSDATSPAIPAVVALTLADLQRLLRQPVEVFFRNRLQVEFDSLDELAQDDEPFALDALQQHNAGAALLASGGDARAVQQLQAAGLLPLAGFGEKTATALLDQAQTVLQAEHSWRQRYPNACAALPIDLTLTDNITLTGTLNGFWRPADAASTHDYLQLAARTGAVLQGKPGSQSARVHVLVGLWVRHLAACASGMAVTSVQIGVDGQVGLKPLAPDAALAVLNRLAGAYQQAWQAPPPVACKTAWAYLQAEQHNLALALAGKPVKDPHELAQEAFEGGRFGGELAESAYVRRVFEHYGDLADGLPAWAQTLYGDLLCAIELSPQALP